MPTVRLTWTDRNSGAVQEEEIRIYRSTSAFTAETLPAVFATLAADTVTYDDTTAVAGATYYYGVAAERGGVLAVSLTGAVIIPLAGIAFTVTVPSGTVASNLTGFPLMIDLSLMPPTFWANVRSDGGNVRVYAADGVTLIPHDLTYIQKARELGRVFARTDLMSASNNVVVVRLLDLTETALAVTDPNGRNAVWSGYQVAIVYPQDVNRTGNVFSRTANEAPFSEWKRVDYYDGLPGTPNQGVAVDASGNLITIQTNAFRRSTVAAPATVLASNLDPVGAVRTATGNANLNHAGDGCIIAGEFWVPISEYPVSGAHDEYLAVFNLTTLALDRTYNVSSVGRHLSAIAQDPDTGIIWATDFNNGASLLQFNTSGTYLGAVTLGTAIPEINGITFAEGSILLATDNRRITKVSKTGVIDVALYNEFTNPELGSGEGLSYVPSTGKLYFMADDGDLNVLEKVDALADWGRLHFDRHSETYPRSTTFSMGASVYWLDPSGDIQQAFLSMANGSTTSQRATLAHRTTSNRIALWNSTDGWLESDIDPAYKDTFRVAAKHNGTTERKLFYNGILKGTDATISARPSGTGTNMSFVFNAADTSNTEEGEAYYQFVWARNDYVSDDWMKADGDNNLNPGAFYTIT